MKPILPLALLAALALQGCIAKTAFDVATAPVRVAGKAVDLATTLSVVAHPARATTPTIKGIKCFNIMLALRGS